MKQILFAIVAVCLAVTKSAYAINCYDSATSASVSCSSGVCKTVTYSGVSVRSCAPTSATCVDGTLGLIATSCCTTDNCNGDSIYCYDSATSISVPCSTRTCMTGTENSGAKVRLCSPLAGTCVAASPESIITSCCNTDNCNAPTTLTTGLKCYSCINCKDSSSYNSTSVPCAGGTCMKHDVNGMVTRSCVSSCVAVSASGIGSTTCCSDKDNCNGVDHMKVNVSAMLFLALSSVLVYLFK